MPIPPYRCRKCGGGIELRMSEEVVCDFCSSPNPRWAYDCEDFTVSPPDIGFDLPEEHMIGGWAACDDCSEIIESGDIDNLTKRSATSFYEKFPMYKKIPEEIKRIILEERGELHKKFMKYRKGPRIPASEYIDSWMKEF